MLKVQFDTLTKREEEIFDLLLFGYRNPQIAKELFISISTVETHRKNIYRKLDISDRVGIMITAINVGKVVFNRDLNGG